MYPLKFQKYEKFCFQKYQPQKVRFLCRCLFLFSAAKVYYHYVEDYFETFVQSYDEHFSRQYGFWRPYIEKVIYRYLDCGDLQHGFARVTCKDCGHEYLLAFSCKRRHFCPSCHQKRVVEFGEWLCMDVLKKVPHRHFIFSLPKILRRYFLYDRKLLAKLSRCAWESLKVFMQNAVPEKEPLPGAVIAVQTFGDFLGFNPHCHIILTDGCFYGNKGMFRVAPPLELKKLEAIFRHKVFRMLLNKGKITKELIAMLSSWRHSGFQVFCGNRISPKDETAMEHLARYIIRASFSQERMRYLEREGTVVYKAKACSGRRSGDGKDQKIFPALEWLAAMPAPYLIRGARISPIAGSRWCDTTAITVTSPGENGKRRARTMPFSLCLNRWKALKLPGKTGRG